MAEGVVTFFLSKLSSLLEEEAIRLWGIQVELQWINDELEGMKAFLKDADRRVKEEGVRVWVKQVRDVAYEAEDVLDVFLLRIGYHQHKVGFRGTMSKGLKYMKNPFVLHEVASQLRSIKERVGQISERSTRYGFNRIMVSEVLEENFGISGDGTRHDQLMPPTVLFEEVEMVGMKRDTEILVENLVGGGRDLKVVAVVGMGGLGKTTLAKKVYNEERVRGHFECFSWVTVSQSFVLQELLRNILLVLLEATNMKEPALNISGSMTIPRGSESVQDALKRYLGEKKYLLVLDDVWSTEIWSQLRSALPDSHKGSRILTTTRLHIVASPVEFPMFVHHLQALSLEDAWVVFCNKAFRHSNGGDCPPELEQLSQSIVKRCDGLPLAVVAVGGVLSMRRMTMLEWKNVHDSLSWELRNDPGLERVRNVLLLSYHDLPCHLKSCFLYCSLFPEDYEITRKRLIHMWIAEGFINDREGMTLEEVGEVFLKELIDRSMLQPMEIGSSGLVKSCRMHDFVRELALSIAKEESFGLPCLKKDINLRTKPRRLSIHHDLGNTPRNEDLSYVRSLLMFVSSPDPYYELTRGFRLLRVLDLQGVLMERLASGVGDLFHLRYLGLRGTKVQLLPKSLGKLRNLQTLDLRETNVTGLPSCFSNLQSLRHLYASPHYEEPPENPDDIRSLCISQSVKYLTRLQTLAYVEVDHSALAHGLRNLTLLRKLGIFVKSGIDWSELVDSIGQMGHLLHLLVASTDSTQPLQLDTLARPPPLLQKMELGGTLEELPPWLCSLHSLTKLRLMWSRLETDPLATLQVLPNLVSLDLHHAYQGRRILVPGGFPRLSHLSLELSELETMTIHLEAMPNLRKMFIARCEKLRSISEALRRAALQEITLVGTMPLVEDLLKYIRYCVPDGKPIPKIEHYFMEDNNWIHHLIDHKFVSAHYEKIANADSTKRHKDRFSYIDGS